MQVNLTLRSGVRGQNEGKIGVFECDMDLDLAVYYPQLHQK